MEKNLNGRHEMDYKWSECHRSGKVYKGVSHDNLTIATSTILEYNPMECSAS